MRPLDLDLLRDFDAVRFFLVGEGDSLRLRVGVRPGDLLTTFLLGDFVRAALAGDLAAGAGDGWSLGTSLVLERDRVTAGILFWKRASDTQDSGHSRMVP